MGTSCRLSLVLSLLALGACGDDGPDQPSALFAGCPAITSHPDVGQALPRATVDTALPTMTGAVIRVRAGESVQAALDAAARGDTIELEAGATFTEPLTLRARPGDGWIILRTSTPDAELALPGTRVTPALAPRMARLQASAAQPVISAAPGAARYRIIGLEIAPTPGSFHFNVVDLSGSATDPAQMASDIILDRSWIHGDPTLGSRRGVALNGRANAVIDSYLDSFMEVGADSQAICGWNSPGPLLIANNHLEGAAENVMFGGADSSAPEFVPSDIQICGNHFTKPIAWRGGPWAVKNLLELKAARRVLIAGNLFENIWPAGQRGEVFVLTPRNQDDAAPWSEVADVTIVQNYARRAGNGMSILSSDAPRVSAPLRRLVVADNVFELDRELADRNWGLVLGRGLEPGADWLLEHNTIVFPRGGDLLAYLGDTDPPQPITRGLRLRHNLFGPAAAGIAGRGTGEGSAALAGFAPGAEVVGNVFTGRDAARYPADNAFPADLAAVGFVDPAGGDWSLASDSPLAGTAPGGRDPGAEVRAVRALAEAARTR